MKKFLPLLVAAVAIAAGGCSTVKHNKVYSYRDEFRDNVKILTRVMLKPEDRRTEIGTSKIIFEHVVNKDMERVDAYFVISRSSSSFKVDKTGFLKADDKKFDLSLINTESGLKIRSEAGISGFNTLDTTGVAIGQMADMDTRAWIEDKFLINLSQEAAASISAAEVVIFRFYFGPIPATYELKGKKLISVQKVLKP
jgi:hypothetical protein